MTVAELSVRKPITIVMVYILIDIFKMYTIHSNKNLQTSSPSAVGFPQQSESL